MASTKSDFWSWKLLVSLIFWPTNEKCVVTDENMATVAVVKSGFCECHHRQQSGEACTQKNTRQGAHQLQKRKKIHLPRCNFCMLRWLNGCLELNSSKTAPRTKQKGIKIGCRCIRSCLILDSTWLLDDTDTMPKLLSGLIDHIALLYLQFLLCIVRQMCNMYYAADLQETRSVLITYPLINFYHYRQTNQVL